MSEIKIAVVGCGKWGMNHVKTALKLFGDNLKYCCDNKDDVEDKIKKISPSVIFTKCLKDVLNDDEVKAVIISTPAETHFAISKELLNAGKNILVEKPITLKSKEAKELNKIAKEKNLILMVGHLLLFHPAILKIKEYLEEGKLGKLQYIYSNRLNLGTVRSEENILWSFAPHDISVIQFLTNDIPLEVKATGAIFLQKNIQDTTLTYLKFKDNVHAHIYVSWLHPFKEHRLVVIGDKSMIVFEDSLSNDKLKFFPKRIDIVNGQPIKTESDFEKVEYENLPALDLEQKHFIDCILNKEHPRSDGKNAIEVLETLEKAQKELLRD